MAEAKFKFEGGHDSKKRSPVKYITTKSEARRAARKLSKQIAKGRPIATDTEFEPDTDEIVLMSFAWDSYGDRYVVDGRLVRKFFGPHLTNPRAKWVYQNYGADADVFYRLGLKTDAAFHADTMVMGWLVNENLLSHGLKAMAWVFLQWRRAEYDALFSYIPEGKKRPVVMTPKQVMHNLPPDALLKHSADEWREIMLNYSGDDAASTIGLYWYCRKKLEKIKYWDNYLKIDRQFTLTLMRCEERGVLIDRYRMQSILRLVDTRIMRVEHAFRAISGKPDFNLNSDPQKKKLFLEELKWPTRDDLVTKTGAPKLDKEAMSWYEDVWREQVRKAEEKGKERAAAVARRNLALTLLKSEFSKESTKRGTFLQGILLGMDEDTHRLHSHFNQIGADTGRISSRKQRKKITIVYKTKRGETKSREKTVKVGANVQNIPSRKEKDPDGIRGAFIAPSGPEQREIRLIAELNEMARDRDELEEAVAKLRERPRGDVTAFGFEAQEDYTLIVADYSGFELCMAIYWLHKIGQHDSKMLKAMIDYKSPSSVHALTAIGMYGDKRPQLSAKNAELYEKVLKPKYGEKVRLRHIKMEDWKLVKAFWPDFYGLAKNGNFNLLYGGSAAMMARLRGQDVRDPEVLAENQAFCDSWNSLYPEIGEYQDYMIHHGYEHGTVPIIGGWQAHVADGLASLDKKMRAHFERKCMNTPCQGSAAWIVKVAMNLIETDEAMRDFKVKYYVNKRKPRFHFEGHDVTLKAKEDKQGRMYVKVPAVALLFPVHDEIILECPMRYADQVEERQLYLMKQPFKDELPFGLDVEAMRGQNWLAAKGG